MSANDGAMMARKPYCPSAQTACSREDPHPKFGPVTRIVAPRASGRLSSNFGSARQSKNRLAPNPVRSTPLRNCFGMIWSVSTSRRGNAVAFPRWRTNGVTASPPAHIHEPTFDRGRGRHCGTHEVRAPAAALAALEIAVRRGRTPLARTEYVGIHAEAHRATGI